MPMIINIAKDFSPVPLGRFREDGKKSGQAFREDHLVPKIRDAISTGDKVVVMFDGMAGFTTAFLDEAFAGLIRKGDVSLEDLKNVLTITASEKHFAPYIKNTWEYIREAAADMS